MIVASAERLRSELPAISWPPAFTLDQERVLNLLTGDRFYSNPSASLREAVLNAIDAANRRRKLDSAIEPEIRVTFNQDELTLAVSDNGIGMSRAEISSLFTKVGASAANNELKKESVGEFGIGVVSYFMSGDTFALQTNDGNGDPIGLLFTKAMLAGGEAAEIPATQENQGTTVKIWIRDSQTFQVLLQSFPHWCRDVQGLSCLVLPEGALLSQGGSHRAGNAIQVDCPNWVERAHLGPIADPTGWNAMTGVSSVAVLYRGVFVQQFEVRGPWGIEGSIDVDPKHFKPRLNREGFVGASFQSEVEQFLKACHPAVLEAMVCRLAAAVADGTLDKWNERRWASLWLSVPRDTAYSAAVTAWDAVFRSLPAFEFAVGNKWEAVSLERLTGFSSEVYVAPLADEKTNDVVQAAIKLLRNTGRPVVRGIRRDKTWMKYASGSYSTTADLIHHVFVKELSDLIPITSKAERILAEVARTAPLFTGPPSVDLVRLGKDSPPALRLKSRLVINIDNAAGKAIASQALNENRGAISLIALAARHAHPQLSEIAAAVREITSEPEILSPIRRRYIRSRLS